ncbi:peptidylprolyl isomerase [Chondromyces apiculatus]|uniref:Survival protein SurA (Peptidyl-prolyl cis-trans isomerase SurA) n=1 Tax=Chondromyces apiculatus DSM 436 TaxID=1192034 RepID=A0A017T7Z4_9BACT|nr:SurA N-terminal domain-containing protein [Chondromyces apiculatus]EYF04930.1 Survival protein SurA precursor (Peptidyl-prolyl cis-trans isomerase SurA) [Chondromyces apiculatus DSM 436]
MRRLRHLAVAGLLLASLSSATVAQAIIVERIVAVIGDRPILLSELRRRARPFLIQVHQKVPPGAQQAAAESQIFRDMMEKMIEDELIAQNAEKASITVSSEELDNAIRNLAAAQGTTVAGIVKLARESSGLTEMEYRDEIRRQILEGKMLQLRVKGRLRVTEQDVIAMYDRVVKAELRRRDYRPAWIVLRVYPGSSAEVVEERMALARTISERIQKGEDFAALAQQFSDDTPTRDQGGDLGIRAPRGSEAATAQRRPVMDAALENALMALEPGQIAEPRQAGNDIVILKLLSRQPSRYTTLEAARPELMQRLQQETMMKARRRWIDGLKRRSHLDVRL